MILRPMPVSSDCFTFFGADSSFITCFSDLGKNFSMGRVYDDACDRGFSMVSAKTGKYVVFVENDSEHDNEGYLIALKCACVTRGFEHLTATIFND